MHGEDDGEPLVLDEAAERKTLMISSRTSGMAATAVSMMQSLKSIVAPRNRSAMKRLWWLVIWMMNDTATTRSSRMLVTKPICQTVFVSLRTPNDRKSSANTSVAKAWVRASSTVSVRRP